MHALRYSLQFFNSFRFNNYPTAFETSFRLPHLGGEYIYMCFNYCSVTMNANEMQSADDEATHPQIIYSTYLL